jgi:hypothetical protein
MLIDDEEAFKVSMQHHVRCALDFLNIDIEVASR